MLLPMLERAARAGMGLHGFQRRWVSTQLGAIHVFDAPGGGALPPMVVLHGIGSNAAPYWPLLRRLRPHVRRVFAPEALGHGASEVPSAPLTPEALFIALAEVLDREISEPAIVFGNSLGGGAALQYAMVQPEKVRALILSSPAGAQMDAAVMESLLDNFRQRSPSDARRFLDRLYHRAPWYSRLIARDIQRQFAREPLQRLIASIRTEHLFRPEQLAELTMPVLLLWGRSDRIMPASNLDFFRAHLPRHARIEEPEGFGHAPYLDNPDSLAERMIRFAREL